MNENTPPDSGTPEPEPTPEPTVEQPVAAEPEVPTQTMAPAATADSSPSWAEDKFKRNTIVGGAAVAGAVVALVGASLFGGDHRGERAERVDFRGGPPGMQGGGMQGGQGMQGGPGMQGGQGMQRGPGYHDQQKQDQSDKDR